MPDPMHATADLPDKELAIAGGPVGPPLTVDAVQRTSAGTQVHVTIPPDHPAYEVIRDNLDRGLSISVSPTAEDGDLYVWDDQTGISLFPPPAVPADTGDTVRLDPQRVGAVVESLADNHRYVKSGSSGALTGAQIAASRNRHVPPPNRAGLGDAIAALFGAELTGKSDEPVREITRVVPNRADRRRARRRA